jgi:hypothetical protein
MPDVIDTLDVAQVATHRIFDNDEAANISQSSVQSILERIYDTLSSSAEITFSFGVSSIPVVDIEIDGIDPGGYHIPDSTDMLFENLDQRTILEVLSDSGSPQDLTIETSYERDGLDLDDRVVTIGAGERKYIGVFPGFIYNHGLTTLNVSQQTPGELKIRAYRLI